MPKLSSETMDERRRHILRSAEACFVRHGFHHTTIADVCREAGVSTGAIYVHFADKEAIIRGILEEAQADRLAQLEAAAREAPADRALVLLKWVSEIFTDEGGQAANIDLNLWSEAICNRRIAKLAAGALQQVSGTVRDLLQERKQSSERLRQLSPEALSAVVVSIFLGLETQAAVGVELAPEEILRVLRALFEIEDAGAKGGRTRGRERKVRGR